MERVLDDAGVGEILPLGRPRMITSPGFACPLHLRLRNDKNPFRGESTGVAIANNFLTFECMLVEFAVLYE